MKAEKTTMERRAGERGVALILALMVLVLLTIMAMGALFTATRSNEIAGSGRYNMEAFYAADAGMNRTVQDVLEYYDKWTGFANPGDPFDLNLDNNSSDDLVAFTPISGSAIDWGDIDGPPTLNQWLNAADVYKVAYFTPQSSCFGTFTEPDTCAGIRYEVLINYTTESVKVLALTRYNNGEQANSESDKIDAAVEFMVNIVSGSICDNAIFGASGSVGHRIVGNVNIHGSMTVLCNGAALGDEGADFGGNSGIYDNWEGGSGPGLSSTMRSRMDPLPENDEGNPSYKSKVLIKTCSAAINSGAFDMGTEDAPLDMVIIDGGLSDPDAADQIHVDDPDDYKTGKDEFVKYVGEDYPSFPELYNDSNVLDTETALGQNVSEDIVNRDLAAVDPKWCSLTDDQDSLYFPAGCNTTGGCELVFDGGANKLTVSSTANKVFDLSGCASATIADIEYDGKASMYYGDSNLILNGNIRVADGESYPTDSVIGFLTAGEMSLCDTGHGNSNCEVMGLFYAQDKITVGMQTNIVGTVITDVFEVGNQVPDFFQVPGLEEQAPAGFDEICRGNPRLGKGGWRLVY